MYVFPFIHWISIEKQTNNTHLTICRKLASSWKGLRNYKLKTFSAQLNDQFIDKLKTGLLE